MQTATPLGLATDVLVPALLVAALIQLPAGVVYVLDGILIGAGDQRHVLQIDAELAERVGLSAAPCWRRVRALEEAGYIKGYHAEIDRHRIGLGVLAFVRLDAGGVVGAHVHSFEESLYVLGGRLTVDAPGGSVELVTGDYGLTAEAIAHQIGLLDPPAEAEQHSSADSVRVIEGIRMRSSTVNTSCLRVMPWTSKRCFAGSRSGLPEWLRS